MTRLIAESLAVFACFGLLSQGSAGMSASIRVSPSAITLNRPEASQQVLVTESASTSPQRDRTRTAEYAISDESIASVEPTGLIRPIRNGRTQLEVRVDRSTIQIPIVVSGVDEPIPVSFTNEIMPILTRAGCNAGGCHGKSDGQNGFKVSVFGFDAELDYESITKHGRGRRINRAAPDSSLLLLKGSAQMPHGGGRKIEEDSHRYAILRRWISEGAFYDQSNAQTITHVSVEPQQVSLGYGQHQQLRVTATDATGQKTCVTTETAFASNADSIATVDEFGLLSTGDIPGEAAIVVSYMGRVDVCRITLPRQGISFPRPPANNFIDKHGWDKLQSLGIRPSKHSSDAMFLRRAFLDTIGTLPEMHEVRSFLANEKPDKRQEVIAQLLDRPEYADFWAMWWADILRVDQGVIQPAGAVAMTRWLRQQMADNRPYDEFVRDILTARGNTTATGPAAFYRVLKEPDELSRSVSQLFLGVRIECAQCHHHPSERWGQDDYFAFAGFFTGLKQKSLPSSSTAILPVSGNDVNHSVTGRTVPTAAFGAPPADFNNVRDRREVLADWIIDTRNPFFTKLIVNRLWEHYFGRGLVEPVDDLRATNPPSNEPLMVALESHLHEVNFDLKDFTKTLLNSRLYQLSSATNASNFDDLQNFSHAPYKPLRAEVLLDAINQAAGTEEKFNGWPTGYRAIQVWDNRMPSYFFRIFGRPLRASVCQCERGDEPSIAQALHLMNSPEIAAKVAHSTGLARKLSKSKKPTSEIIEALFLSTLARLPTEQEQQLMTQGFRNRAREVRDATEDVLWTLLNTKEFLYNH